MKFIKKILLMASYYASPLWELFREGGKNINPSSLPLSHDLINDLTAWAKNFDETLNFNRMVESGFDNQDGLEEFLQQGDQLFIRLKNELGPNIKVYYQRKGELRSIAPPGLQRKLLFNYTCQNCGAVLNLPSTGGLDYGTLLFRSTGDNLRLASTTVEDPVVNEVKSFIESSLIYNEIPSNIKVKAFKEIFGVTACDPDNNGFVYIIGKNPYCTNCSVQEITKMRETFPPEYCKILIPTITHLLWNALSKSAKIERVNHFLNSYYNRFRY